MQYSRGAIKAVSREKMQTELAPGKEVRMEKDTTCGLVNQCPCIQIMPTPCPLNSSLPAYSASSVSLDIEDRSFLPPPPSDVNVNLCSNWLSENNGAE